MAHLLKCRASLWRALGDVVLQKYNLSIALNNFISSEAFPMFMDYLAKITHPHIEQMPGFKIYEQIMDPVHLAKAVYENLMYKHLNMIIAEMSKRNEMDGD